MRHSVKSKQSTKTSYFGVNRRLRSSMLITRKACHQSSFGLATILFICNRLQAKLVDIGKNRAFWKSTGHIWCPSPVRRTS